VAKPAGLSWAAAAALVTVGEAAFRVLKHLNLSAGQTLLILGAGGSAGTIATQLAVARGLTVVGTAGPDDARRLSSLGASAVRYGDGWADRVRAAAPDGVDAVFDTTGAGLLAGAVSLAGGPARVITIADPDAAVRQVRFTGADPADRAPEAQPELGRLMAAGQLTVPVWRGYPLAEAATAHADLEAGRNHGKIVLRP
jgi:NADPH:quinone reductase-like Zn-dependent oxidoreductase